MKQAWTDLKSFVTIWLMLILAVVVVGNMFGLKLDQEVLLLYTNLTSSVITYYFVRKKNKETENETNNKEESI